MKTDWYIWLIWIFIWFLYQWGCCTIHTEILKHSELKDFYDLYPAKFNNKTNGITFRRWLLSCNEELTDYIDHLIGEDYKEDAMHLEDLLTYKDDYSVLTKIINQEDKKKQLVEYIQEHEGIKLDEDESL